MTATDIKNGMTIQYNNGLFQVLWFQHHKPGKGQAMVNAKLKNLRTGAITDFRFNPDEKIEKAQIEKINAIYSYEDGSYLVFLDSETYEQHQISRDFLEYEQKYLYEGLEIQIIKYNSEILGIILPEKITLEVTETEPGVKGDTKTTASKDAIVQTGLLVKVPLFINVGDRIVVSSSDGSYVSREK